jgi:hypothetical protein
VGVVSNLLGSPASGELEWANPGMLVAVFPIYWVPQRVGRLLDLLPLIPIIFVSNLLGSPASGEAIVKQGKVVLL